MRMTYGIAYSLGLDAANRQMQQAGRRAWNEEDAELAAATLNRHFPPLCRGAGHPSGDLRLQVVPPSTGALLYRVCSGRKSRFEGRAIE